MNSKGQLNIVNALIGLIISVFFLYFVFVLFEPLNDLISPFFSEFSNGEIMAVFWGLIPLICIFAVIIAFLTQATSPRQPTQPY